MYAVTSIEEQQVGGENNDENNLGLKHSWQDFLSEGIFSLDRPTVVFF